MTVSVRKVPPSTGRSGLIRSLKARRLPDTAWAKPQFTGPRVCGDEPARSTALRVAYMIDQSLNIEPKLEAMLRSVLNCQTAYAKALLVDYAALRAAQQDGDVLAGHSILMDAFQTDVRPLVCQVRVEMGVPVDPIAALKADSYRITIVEERGTARSTGSGYPGA